MFELECRFFQWVCSMPQGVVDVMRQKGRVLMEPLMLTPRKLYSGTQSYSLLKSLLQPQTHQTDTLAEMNAAFEKHCCPKPSSINPLGIKTESHYLS